MLLLTIPHDYDNHPDVFDYIVVGSGPGGGPLAANLARAGHTVLLLEAGDDQGNNLDEMIPVRFINWEEDPMQRWDFFVKHYDDEVCARQFDITLFARRRVVAEVALSTRYAVIS
jgi:choline dehydrogenase